MNYYSFLHFNMQLLYTSHIKTQYMHALFAFLNVFSFFAIFRTTVFCDLLTSSGQGIMPLLGPGVSSQGEMETSDPGFVLHPTYFLGNRHVGNV